MSTRHIKFISEPYPVSKAEARASGRYLCKSGETPREAKGLLESRGFVCSFNIVFSIFYVFQGIHSFPFLLIFLSDLRRGGCVFREPRANSAGGVVVVAVEAKM